jgi:cytochrome c553
MNSQACTTAIVLLTTVLMSCGAARAQSAGSPDTIAARVQGCATCHGRAGEGSADENFPRIAGKPAGYLFNQLQNFREGRRSYPPMNYLLGYLHDDYFKDMAAFFAAQRIPFAKPEHSVATAAGMRAGEQLARQGDSAHGVPPCVVCHGPRLSGIEPGIPGLVGLHSRYISAQLEAWRAGTRHARLPDCMREIASRLTESQITEVAAYLAAQPAPDASLPAPQGSWKTALSCGSQP